MQHKPHHPTHTSKPPHPHLLSRDSVRCLAILSGQGWAQDLGKAFGGCQGPAVLQVCQMSNAWASIYLKKSTSTLLLSTNVRACRSPGEET
eukprot:356003-Chlamydomonas_euryale.AAC.7